MPQLDADVDREQGEAARACRSPTCSRRCRSISARVYVNDFNKFGRTYQVIAAGGRAVPRAPPTTSRSSRSATPHGEMVPLGSVLQVKQSHGPDQATHYNGYPAADINGGPAPGVQLGPGGGSDRADSLREVLPNGIGYEWTELDVPAACWPATPPSSSSRSACCSCFLVLAAQYESWSLPLAVILIVPMSLLCAIGGRVAHPGRQQRLHADRLPGAGRARVQERDPDRRVRRELRAPGHARVSTRRWRPAASGSAPS